MSIFSPYYFMGGTIGTGSLTGGTAGQMININYSYSPNIDVRGNKHADLDRLAELQKLVTKHPNRTDYKMELMKLQKLVSPKIGKRKKKK